jgi:UDP-N-acetylmuramoylalanine--D-glutamate ligase
MNDFVPPPHRCELVATVNGIRYIDDSKGTNVAASIAAMSSIEGEKIVILGGQGKGEDYIPLAQEVSRSSYAAILIGEEKDPIASALTKEGYSAIFMVSSMEEAVQIASSIAVEGSTVLLSPACTSWDMYESYQKRGDHFKKVVKNLEQRKGCKDV